MKTTYQIIPGNRTWRDIWALGGSMLDILALGGLIVISGIILLLGAGIVIFDYLCYPVVLLLAWWRKEPGPEPRLEEPIDPNNDYRLFLP